jgi:hypothetical protein
MNAVVVLHELIKGLIQRDRLSCVQVRPRPRRQPRVLRVADPHPHVPQLVSGSDPFPHLLLIIGNQARNAADAHTFFHEVDLLISSASDGGDRGAAMAGVGCLFGEGGPPSSGDELLDLAALLLEVFADPAFVVGPMGERQERGQPQPPG